MTAAPLNRNANPSIMVTIALFSAFPLDTHLISGGKIPTLSRAINLGELKTQRADQSVHRRSPQEFENT